MESGETTEQAALREVWEESGVRADIVSPYSIFSVPKISEVYIIFRAIAPKSPASTGRRPSTTSSSNRMTFPGTDLLPGDPADSRALHPRAAGRGVWHLHGQ
jgi:8-oxo-dGTP pyrophosphatase MutT (NUDIX family)